MSGLVCFLKILLWLCFDPFLAAVRATRDLRFCALSSISDIRDGSSYQYSSSYRLYVCFQLGLWRCAEESVEDANVDGYVEGLVGEEVAKVDCSEGL